MAKERISLGKRIYDALQADQRLSALYDGLLKAYTRELLKRTVQKPDEREIIALLRYADLLSKSDVGEKTGLHRIWAQQIVALLGNLFPNDNAIELYTESVLRTCNNYQGLKQTQAKSEEANTPDLLDDLVEITDKEYFTIPGTTDQYFFEDQKSIFEGFEHKYFSYSAPTSMGKSYIMRIFIKRQIQTGSDYDFAIIVPTKALINEIRQKIVQELGSLLKERNYCVVVSGNDIMLEQDRHYIFVMTPERFVYLLGTKKNDIRYLFIDEAHKISEIDKRSLFYYEMMEKVSNLESKPNVIFASPNIPNPEVYFGLIPNMDENAIDQGKKRVLFSPVSQIKYLVDLNSGEVDVYNDFTKQLVKVGNDSPYLNLNNLILKASRPSDKNIVYCNSIDKVMEYSSWFASTLPKTNDQRLIQLASDIRHEIHDEYLLAELIERGVAFHVGYLPASIRLRIEDEFKHGGIRTIFCTSTLMEGVNLPADNLFITSYKNGRSKLDEVSFRNLIGRVGRLEHGLFGNVFLVVSKEDQKAREQYIEKLSTEIKSQQLSLETLEPRFKKAIVSSLSKGDFEIGDKPNRSTEKETTMMRESAVMYMNSIGQDEDNSLRKCLDEFATPEQKEAIKTIYQKAIPTTSIQISPDQHKNIRELVEGGLTYPSPTEDGKIDSKTVAPFLAIIGSAFKWQVYERLDLGKCIGEGLPEVEEKHYRWYGNLLREWMSGYGLSYIVSSALRYKGEHPESGVWSGNRKVFETFRSDDPRDVNLVIGDTLRQIENVILFSVANYFRCFSEEYKRYHQVEDFDNDWYEYVEYGTTNKLTILLQRYGYTRETANYIVKRKDLFVIENKGNPKLPFLLAKERLLASKNVDVVDETAIVSVNTPELFAAAME